MRSPKDVPEARLDRSVDRRGFLKGAAALSATLAVPGVLAACGDDDEQAAALTGSLRMVVTEPFSGNWYPYTQTAGVERRINQLLFDRLVEVTPDEALAPGLAESWKTIDPRTWELKLRKGVKFHDGRPFGPEDVKASIELASGQTGEASVISALWGVPQQVEIVDDSTVRLRGKQPLGPMLSLLATTDILSAKDVARGVEALGKAPNGTGPFRLAADGRNRKKLARYEGYYRGPAQLKSTTWEFIQDPQARVNALEAGQVDAVDRVDPDTAARLDSQSDIEVASVVSAEIQLLLMRPNRPPFKDNPALRRAVAWGIDRGALASLVGGDTAAGTSHLAPANFFYAEQEPAYAFDPERAKAELDRAGVSTPLELELIGAKGSFPKLEETVELITQSLGEIGIAVRSNLVELGAYFDALGQGQGDLIYAAWNSAAPDPQMALGSMYSPNGAGGLWGIDDPELNEMLGEGVATVEEGEREQIYAKVQSYMWENLPSLPLFYQQISVPMADRVTGLEVQPTPQIDFWPVKA